MLERLRQLERTEGRVALATIIRTKGSTPRKAGAKMIVYPDGRTEGTIGGGCGESEIRQAALGVMDTGRPRRFSVELLGDFGDEKEVCGGIVYVWIEPLEGRDDGHDAQSRTDQV